MQNTVNVKRDLNDYILRSNRLQDEVGLLQRDKENLNGQLNTLQIRVRFVFFVRQIVRTSFDFS